MEKIKSICILLVSIVALISCTTAKLTQEEMDNMVQGAILPITAENTKIEYQPVEVVKYVFPKTGEVIDETEISNSEEILENANNSSIASISSKNDFKNAITEYFFEDGKIYEVFTNPNSVTDIRLAPGETISGNAALGNSEGWMMESSVSSEKGRSVTHIFIRPTVANMETSMIVPTDQRTYYLRLKSFENLAMIGVRWKYPSIATFNTSSSSINGNQSGSDTAININLSNANYGYKITGKNSIWWRPVSVFDDGNRTYIQFDPRFSTTAGAPALYFLNRSSDGKENAELFNYITRGNLYITESVLMDNQAYYLMDGSDFVRITRK